MSNLVQTKTILISVLRLTWWIYSGDPTVSFYFPKTSFQTSLSQCCFFDVVWTFWCTLSFYLSLQNKDDKATDKSKEEDKSKTDNKSEEAMDTSKPEDVRTPDADKEQKADGEGSSKNEENGEKEIKKEAVDEKEGEKMETDEGEKKEGGEEGEKAAAMPAEKPTQVKKHEEEVKEGNVASAAAAALAAAAVKAKVRVVNGEEGKGQYMIPQPAEKPAQVRNQERIWKPCHNGPDFLTVFMLHFKRKVTILLWKLCISELKLP